MLFRELRIACVGPLAKEGVDARVKATSENDGVSILWQGRFSSFLNGETYLLATVRHLRQVNFHVIQHWRGHSPRIRALGSRRSSSSFQLRSRVREGPSIDLTDDAKYKEEIEDRFTLGCQKRKIFRDPEVNDGKLTVCLLERWEVLAGIP